ncbi:MAG TPA: hypothetical protein VMW24_09215 [Sedimentisphaerales bacterium]|nr:hypothetical protein [Sedimentisphaerales bacterium]
MKKHVTDQYLHGTDELIDALRKRETDLRVRFGKLVGKVYGRDEFLPLEPDPKWSDEAKEVHREYQRVGSETWRRGSRRCALQVSRIMQILNTEGSTPEVVRWFRARY